MSDIAALWLELEKNSSTSFFLTWDWIGSWLKQLPMDFFLVKVLQSKRLVGLAVIVEKRRKTLGVFNTSQWWLNRSGCHAYDQCWIEENTALAAIGYEHIVNRAICSFLLKQKQWQEFILGMAGKEVYQEYAGIADRKRILIDDVGYSVTLESDEWQYAAQVLSRKTRQKIRQTEKILSSQGELCFEVLTGRADKNEQYTNIQRLHKFRWQGTVTPSGFENMHFQAMIHNLIQNDKTEFSVLTLNQSPVAYLINFVHEGKVNFYLSALERFSDPKVKVGMLVHQKSIEYYANRGMSVYDFLAGEARYKASMSNVKYEQKMIVFYRESTLLRIERFMRVAKNKIRDILIR
ncbi:GNAT family N-acetyltransferase [Endozoicomonas sp. G2_1]|uniref:GNAT family N-acetyltransferase n=1 Tax=Endozoicomonas sp. G2_1 TaxID=2821091 RepID=UPI001ADCC6AA|nr:GNAT family N-acetyltransferase [Endozoicomonas sp. G2_1]MBO9490496.1 GNAT family N-acetyltransferase [Endozoicomonas sp. G2_1]